jgi:transcriptional regulator with XRE-family HTH domain
MLITNQITFSVNMPTRLELAGAWLQGEREKAEVSQQKVADKSGIHVIHISRAENGKTGLRRETVEVLVNAINDLSTGHKINVDDALIRFGHSADSQLPPRNAQDLIEALNRLGITGFEHIEPYNLEPEEFQQLLDDIRLVVELRMRRR